MRRLTPALLLATAATAAAAVTVLPAAGDGPATPEEAIAAARAAFPVLATAAPGTEPTSSSLPTSSDDATVVGEGTVGPMTRPAHLTLTDEAEVCLTVADTSTCQPAELVADYGIYVAASQCSPATADVAGVVPDGVEDVAVLGASTPITTTAASDGSVAVTVPGATMTGLDLDNDAIAPLKLGADCDRPAPPSPRP
jgi:hypothetical protein